MRSRWVIFAGTGAFLAGGSIWVWHRYSQSVEGTLWGTISGSFAILCVLGAWARRSRSGTAPPGAIARRLANGLAGAVVEQWQTEEQIRDLNNSSTIPMKWKNTDRQVADHWHNIRSDKVDEPINLSGTLSATTQAAPDGITEVFERVPSGRLVMLGAPGSGKTVLAVRLVTSISERRKDGLLAVLLPLASWNCEKLSFHAWVISRLTEDYPNAVTSTGEAGEQETKLLMKLLRSGKVVFVLDGLDELPASLRADTIDQLNKQLSDREPIVLTCRSAEYEEADRVLRGAAVVEIQPLDPSSICEYLHYLTPPRPRDRQKWDPIQAELTSNPTGPLAQALDTPLMVWLARTVFGNTAECPGLLVSREEDGSRLFPTSSSIKDYLLDHVISATYATTMVDDANYRRVSGKSAERWLTFLAVHMAKCGTYDLAAWHLHRWMNRTSKFLVYGCAFGAVIGWSGALLYSPRFGLSFGIITGLSAGGAAAYAGPAEPPYGRESEEPFLEKYKSGLSFTVSLWAASGLAAAISLGFRSGILVWCWEALAAAVAGALAVLLSQTKIDTQNKQATAPATVLKLSSRVTLAWALIFGSLLGLGMGLSEGADAALVAGLIGVLGAVLANAWGGLVATRGYFALGRRLPWGLMAFLADAHRRGILRQVGAVYQFRHATIQDRLVAQACARKNKPVKGPAPC